MLYVNDELIKKGSPQWERYEEFRRDVLSTMRNPVIFKTSRPIRFNKTGLPEAPILEMIPLDYTIVTEEGEEHWRIAARPPRKKDGNNIWDKDSRRKILKNAWVFDKVKHQEMIFFLMTVSPFVKKGKIYCQDKDKEAREAISNEVGELDVKHLILSEMSPLGAQATGSEDMLRMLAAAWGVNKAHDKKEHTLDQIKLALWGVVKSSEANRKATNRGYKEFIAEADTKNLLEIRANIQRAIDSGLIVYDNPTFSWRFAANNTPLMIVPAEQGSTPQIALYNFLSLNSKSAEILKFAMSSPYDIKPENIKPETITPKDVDENRPSQQDVEALSWGDLKKLAVSLGIGTFQKKKPELTEIILGVLAT